jgi:hypothetical protein
MPVRLADQSVFIITNPQMVAVDAQTCDRGMGVAARNAFRAGRILTLPLGQKQFGQIERPALKPAANLEQGRVLRLAARVRPFPCVQRSLRPGQIGIGSFCKDRRTA